MILDKPLQVDAYTFENPNQRLLLRFIKTDESFYNLKFDDVVIARGKDKVFYSPKSFYIYDLYTVRSLGCYLVSYFEIIGVFDTLEDLQIYVQHHFQQDSPLTILKDSFNNQESEVVPKEVEYGQMNLFDF